MKTSAYGQIVERWDIQFLKNLCVPGGIQTGPFGSQLHQKDYLPVGTPIITVEHLGENRIVHEDLPRISDEDKDRLSRYIMRKGDIIFSRVGSVDRRSLVRNQEDGWLFSGRCLRVRPDPKKVNPDFLSWFFGLEAFKDYIRRIAVGATMPSLNTEILSNVPIVVPPLPEQRAIADVLGSLDDKIELNRRMNATLESMARAVFKAWFVDSEEAKGWKVGILEELADLNPEAWSNKSAPSQVEYIDLSNTKWGTIEETIIYSWKDAPSRARRILRPGDTILGTVRPGNGSYALITRKGLTGSTGFAVLRPKSVAYREYVYLATTSKENIEWFAHLADGAAYPAIRPEIVISSEIARPPDEILEKFSTIAKPLMDKIASNDEQSRTLAALRDALLPRLMSGEVKVKASSLA